MLNVNEIVNFYGENMIVGNENSANRKKRAPHPNATNALKQLALLSTPLKIWNPYSFGINF